MLGNMNLVANNPANRRWYNANIHAAKIIKSDILDGRVADFNFVPGVNTQGYGEAELKILSDSFAVSGKKVFACHSAGTQTCLETIGLMTQSQLKDTVFVFMSPRMEFSQFDSYLRGKLDKSQAVVIGARKDLYHFADALYYQKVNGTPLIDFGSISAYHQQAVFDYGYNDNPSYNFMFLDDDISVDINGNPVEDKLDHGSMFEGEIEKHEYEVRVNRTQTAQGTIGNIFQQIIAGVYDEN